MAADPLSHTTSIRPALRFGAIVLVATAVACLRTGSGPMRVLWAEDASPFVHDAALIGGARILFRPYAGYLHLLPRLIAAAVVELPVDGFAIGMSAASCLVVGVVAALTFELARSVTASRTVRITLAAAVVLVPVAPIEVLGNAANLHSYCLWLVPWILLATPQRRAGAAWLGVAALVIALTEIQTVLFAPFVPLLLRDRRLWPRLAGFGGGLAMQAVALLAAPRELAGPGAPGPIAIGKAYLVNGFVSLALPQAESAQRLLRATGWTPALAAFLVVAAGLAFAAWCAPRRPRLAVAMLAYGSVATCAVGYALTPLPDYNLFLTDVWPDATPLRYAAIASLFLVGAIILAAGELSRLGRLRSGNLVLVAVWAICLWHLEPRWTFRQGGPRWDRTAGAAMEACRAKDEGAWLTVPAWPRGVVIELPCRRFREHRGA